MPFRKSLNNLLFASGIEDENNGLTGQSRLGALLNLMAKLHDEMKYDNDEVTDYEHFRKFVRNDEEIQYVVTSGTK